MSPTGERRNQRKAAGIAPAGATGMSITYSYDQIDESQGELSSSAVSYERKYRVVASDTAEEIDVINYLNGQVARKVGVAFCESISAEAQDGSQNKIWTVTVRWRKQYQNKREEPDYPKQDLGLLDETFQTQEERKRVYYSHAETVYSRSGYSGSNVYNRIGMSGEGAEVGAPTYTFSLNKRFDYTEVNAVMKNRWLNMFGCVNSAAFREFGPGVVRFVGFSGRAVVEYDGSLVTIGSTTYQAAQAYYDVTFNFQAKPIETQTIGGITCADVPGWAYPWTETIKVDDPNTGRTVDLPVAVHVANIYPSADLSLLFTVPNEVEE